MATPDPREQSRARRLAVELRYAFELRALPLAVARFQWRARRTAWKAVDTFSLTSTTRPKDLAILLSIAARSTTVVELGSATGWTAISLALASPERRVFSYDPVDRRERARYLNLVDVRARARIEFITAPGVAGPAPGVAGPPPGLPVDFLYVDSSHEYEQTLDELRVWLPVLAEGAVIAFDDYEHPGFPGVRAAVSAAGLDGELQGKLFVHRVKR